MQKFTFEELPEAVADLYGKMEGMERFFDNSSNKKGLSFNYLTKEQCCTYLNKSDLAQLFYIFMDEKIFFFDDHKQKRNRNKIQVFIEDNFTYAGDAGLQTDIDTISKQLSEAKGFTYKDKQMRFLENIICTLQKRREKLIYW